MFNAMQRLTATCQGQPIGPHIVLAQLAGSAATRFIYIIVVDDVPFENGNDEFARHMYICNAL